MVEPFLLFFLQITGKKKRREPETKKCQKVKIGASQTFFTC
jgi:hypothetical protein